MERLGFPVSIVDFQARFAGDAACLDYLAASRWPQGFTCPACGGGKAWVLARRHLWECAVCGRQTSVTAGTIMDHTHIPLALWFWAAYLMATHTPGISAVHLQRQLGIRRYETAWYLLHKLRRAMIAPERGLLTGEVEADEGFVGGRNSARRGGRDRTGNALVAVAVEVRGTGSGRSACTHCPAPTGPPCWASSRPRSPPRRSCTPTAGLGTGTWPGPGMTTARLTSTTGSPAGS